MKDNDTCTAAYESPFGVSPYRGTDSGNPNKELLLGHPVRAKLLNDFDKSSFSLILNTERTIFIESFFATVQSLTQRH